MKDTTTLGELADHIGAHLEGVASRLPVIGIATLAGATHQQVSFFSSRQYRQQLSHTQAAAVIISPSDRSLCPVPVLMMENPYLGYAKAAQFFNLPPKFNAHIHSSSVISPHATIGQHVFVDAHVVIKENVMIGDNVIIESGCTIQKNVTISSQAHLRPHVTIYPNTKIGERVIIHSGTVVGSDGFGLANDQGTWVKIPQLGGVIIGDDVEIGANTTIDKGALEDTIIGSGVKLDNQIQIGHNVTIGEHTAIAGCVGIAGSTRIGKHCMIAGGVGIVGHIEITDHVYITGGSIVLQSILSPGTYSSGVPLQTNSQWHRNYHRFKQLDTLLKRLQQLEDKIK